jgi:two-component system sensor histidine kinase EvgS
MGTGVLIVDDCPLTRLIVREELHALGFSTAEAANGAAALAWLERQPCDAVLMDCQMPGLDGYETTRRLRRWDLLTGRRTVVIGLTASAGPEEEERSRAAGMDGLLAKPLDPQAFAALLARAGLGLLGGEILGAFGRLGGRVGEDLLGQVMASFLADGQRWLAAMRGALGTGDARALAAAAHSLSGAAAILRVPALEQCCEDLETFVLKGNVSGSGGLVAAVAAAYGRALSELRPSAPEALLQGGPAVAQGAEGRLDPVGGAELAEEVGEVGAHGRFRDVET